MTDILQALSSLQPEEDAHWTTDGSPRLEAVAQLLGVPVTRAEVLAVAPRFSRTSPLLPPEDPEDVLDAPQTVTLEDRLAQARSRLQEAEEARSEAVRAVAAVQAELDALVMEQERTRPRHENQLAIMNYLESQKRLRLEAAAQRQQAVAPVDQAMRRKTGFGLNRPMVPTTKS